KKEHILDMRGMPISTYEKEYRGGYIAYGDIIQLGTYATFKRYDDSIYKKTNNIDDIISDLKRDLTKASKFDIQHISKSIAFFEKIKEIDYFFEVELRELYNKSANFLSNYKSLTREKRTEKYKEHRAFDEMIQNKVTK